MPRASSMVHDSWLLVAGVIAFGAPMVVRESSGTKVRIFVTSATAEIPKKNYLK